MMRMTVTRMLMPTMFAALLLLLGGCSNFNKDFEAERAAPISPSGITGAWQGTWQSEASDHKGTLRAIVTQTTPNIFHIRYRATYGPGQIITFEYSLDFPVQRQGQEYQFTGSADLGWTAGGVYTYQGHASPTDFFSTYKSSADSGTYTLKRP